MLWTTNSYKRAIIASAMTHAAILLVFLALHHSGLRFEPTENPKPLLIEVVSPSKSRNQIVQSQKGTIVDQAKEDALLGKENRVVEKQTLGRTAQVSLPRAQPRSKEDLKSTEEMTDSSKDQASAKSQKKPYPVSLKKLGVPLFPKNSESMEAKKESQPAPRPAWADFAKAHRGEVDPDYVKGIEQGNETALNTKEFVFYGYFERIRSRLNQAWRPLLQAHILKFYKTGRTIANHRDHVTRILVTLDQKGDIVKVQILEKSGTHILDDSAVKAFNRAGPFPNPPRGLVDTTGQIKIRWDFILKS